MRYSLSIDQPKSVEWGLNINQAHLFSLLTQLNMWAQEIIIDGKTYYFASRNMVIKEIPLCYSKPDTVYKAFCKLRDLNLIEYKKFGSKDLIRIAEKGMSWNRFKSDNSEINPNELGNKSESNSEINPTDHNTNIDHDTTYSKKENKEFSKTVTDTYNSILNYFPENIQPKNESSKNKWKDEIRKIIEIDKKPPHEIEFVIKWARNNEFWKSNFLSLLKLRKNNREGISYYNVFLTKIKNGNNTGSQQKKLSIYPDKNYSASWD